MEQVWHSYHYCLGGNSVASIDSSMSYCRMAAAGKENIADESSYLGTQDRWDPCSEPAIAVTRRVTMSREEIVDSVALY